MNQTSRIILLLLMLGAVCNTRAQSNAAADTAQITNITIASEPDYPPYCIINKKGTADGFSIDLFKAAASAAGIKVNIKIGVWNQIKQDLAEGKIDALPLVGRTPEREKRYDFTNPYLTLHGAIFVREGTTGIKSLADLKDKTVIVMKGDNAEEYVRRSKITNKIITTNTFEEAFHMLAAGQYDAVITQRVTGIKLLDAYNIDTVIPLDIQLNDFNQDFCFAVRKGNSALLNKLNEGLSVVIADKTYNRLHYKWFGPDYNERFTYRNVIKLLLYVLIPFMLMLSLISVFILRREVRRKTKSLQDEIVGHKRAAVALKNQQLLLSEMEKVSRVGGWEYIVETRKTSWTDGVFRIYGVQPTQFEPSLVNQYLPFYSPTDQEKLDTAFDRALRFGEPYNIVLKFTSSDGTYKWLRTSGQAEFLDRAIVRVFGNVMDVTAQKQAVDDLRRLKDDLEIIILERTTELEEKVQKLHKSELAMLYMVEDLNQTNAELNMERQKLQAANKELEAFSYSVSHDLRAPLRALDGFSRILQEDYGSLIDAEGNRLLQVIADNANKMGTLIDDLLSFSRLGRQEMKFSKIDMHAMADAVFRELVANPDKEHLTFLLSPIPGAFGDASLMRQVWVNLIGNALKFTAKKPSRLIEIGCSIQHDENIYFVKDNGAGFNMNYANKLFGVFQRLHSQKDFIGTGIGLSIIQRIILRHNGRVWAEGQVDEGAVFYFALPIQA